MKLYHLVVFDGQVMSTTLQMGHLEGGGEKGGSGREGGEKVRGKEGDRDRRGEGGRECD